MSPPPPSDVPRDLKAFGRWLEHLRKQKGWSKAALARKAGVKAEYLAMYERGEMAPREETILDLARALGKRYEELVGGPPLPSSAPASVEVSRATSPSAPPEDGIARLLVPGTSKRPAKFSPSNLLSAPYAWVDFIAIPDQTRIQRELQEWCRDKEQVAARLVHGAAGTGKTRLLIECCSELRKEGWEAGFLVDKTSSGDFEKLVEASARRSILVVIDYAESRQDLVGLLQVVARRRDGGGQGRFRLVLLARSQGDWWSALSRRETALKSLLTDMPPLRVATDVLEVPVRVQLFQQAARRFAEVLGQAAPTRVPAYLEEPRFDRVLLIHMAALAEVAGLPLGGRDVRESLLEHEERFWRVWQESASPGEPPDMERRLLLRSCQRAVTALTLVGGATSGPEARELMLRACQGHEGLELILLRDLYPGAWEASGQRYVGTLEPDHLGAALVQRTLEAEGAEAGRWLKEVFAVANEQGWRRIFEILGRLCMETREAKEWVGAVLEGHVAARAASALEAAKALGAHQGGAVLDEILAGVLRSEGTVEVAKSLSRALPLKGLAGLPNVSRWVKARLSQSR